MVKVLNGGGGGGVMVVVVIESQPLECGQRKKAVCTDVKQTMMVVVVFQLKSFDPHFFGGGAGAGIAALLSYEKLDFVLVICCLVMLVLVLVMMISEPV